MYVQPMPDGWIVYPTPFMTVEVDYFVVMYVKSNAWMVGCELRNVYPGRSCSSM